MYLDIPLPGPFRLALPIGPAVGGCLFWLIVGPLLIWWWLIVGMVWIIGATVWGLVKLVEVLAVGVLRLTRK